MSGAAPVGDPAPSPGENRERGGSGTPRPESPHSPARPSADPVLPVPHACPHGCVHPGTSRGQPRLLSSACAPGHRRDGADTESQGVQRVVPGPLPVVRRPSWGPQDILFLRAPRHPVALLAWSSLQRRYRRGAAAALLSSEGAAVA